MRQVKPSANQDEVRPDALDELVRLLGGYSASPRERPDKQDLAFWKTDTVWRSETAERLDRERRRAVRWYTKRKGSYKKQSTKAIWGFFTIKNRWWLGPTEHAHEIIKRKYGKHVSIASINVTTVTMEMIIFEARINDIAYHSFFWNWREYEDWQREQQLKHKAPIRDAREYGSVVAKIDKHFRFAKKMYIRSRSKKLELDRFVPWVDEGSIVYWEIEKHLETEEYRQKALAHAESWLKSAKSWPLDRWRERERKRKRRVERQAKKAGAFFQAMAMASAVKGEAINE